MDNLCVHSVGVQVVACLSSRPSLPAVTLPALATPDGHQPCLQAKWNIVVPKESSILRTSARTRTSESKGDTFNDMNHIVEMKASFNLTLDTQAWLEGDCVTDECEHL